MLFEQWLKKNITLLTNASSLVGTTAVTSLLGFVYWWVAARQFSLDSVGIASASLSIMTLLGSCCVLGLGTLLITELPRQPDRAASLMSTAFILAGGLGTLAGLGFVLVAPYVSPHFQPLRANAVTIVIFVSGVSLTAISLVLDQALVGLLRARLQLWRNSFFAVAKLALLLAVSLMAFQTNGMAIYLTWTTGIALSLLSLLRCIKLGGKRTARAYLPQWQLVRKLGPSALQHYLLNLILQVPIYLMPVLVTILLSTRANAWFYVAWMIAGFVFVVPVALTNVLHAMNSAQPTALSQKVRATLGIAVATCILANLVLLFGTEQVLGLFGQSYADQAAWALRILALCSFPLIIRYHFMSICRIQDRIPHAIFRMAPGGLLELLAAALGAHYAGLAGMTLGWLSVLVCEALSMSPTIYRTLRGSQLGPLTKGGEDPLMQEPVWLMDTLVWPTNIPLGMKGASTTGDAHAVETLPLPSQKHVVKKTEGEDPLMQEPVWLVDTLVWPTNIPPGMKGASTTGDAHEVETLPLPSQKHVVKKTSALPHSNPGFDEIDPDFIGSNWHLKPIRLRSATSVGKCTPTKDTPDRLSIIPATSRSGETPRGNEYVGQPPKREGS